MYKVLATVPKPKKCFAFEHPEKVFLPFWQFNATFPDTIHLKDFALFLESHLMLGYPRGSKERRAINEYFTQLCNRKLYISPQQHTQVVNLLWGIFTECFDETNRPLPVWQTVSVSLSEAILNRKCFDQHTQNLEELYLTSKFEQLDPISKKLILHLYRKANAVVSCQIDEWARDQFRGHKDWQSVHQKNFIIHLLDAFFRMAGGTKERDSDCVVPDIECGWVVVKETFKDRMTLGGLLGTETEEGKALFVNEMSTAVGLPRTELTFELTDLMNSGLMELLCAGADPTAYKLLQKIQQIRALPPSERVDEPDVSIDTPLFSFSNKDEFEKGVYPHCIFKPACIPIVLRFLLKQFSKLVKLSGQTTRYASLVSSEPTTYENSIVQKAKQIMCEKDQENRPKYTKAEYTALTGREGDHNFLRHNVPIRAFVGANIRAEDAVFVFDDLQVGEMDDKFLFTILATTNKPALKEIQKSV